MLVTVVSNGQNFISDLSRNGSSVQSLKINITVPQGKSSEVEIRKSTPISSGSILKIPSESIVYITSGNGNIGKIIGPSTVEFRSSSTGEEYRVIEGDKRSNVFITVFKKLTGGVLASGPTGEIHARSRLTEFLIAVAGDSSKFELIKGKIDINQRQKIEIKDGGVIDSLKRRALFIRETNQLSLKNPTFNFAKDSLSETYLDTEKDIKKFFRIQHQQQKRLLYKSGFVTKSAYKKLNNGKLIDEAISLFEEAIDTGEISIDLLVQSSLMLADVYFSKDDLDTSAAWLDAGLYFSERLYKIQKEKFDYYSQNNKDKIAKAFGYDLIVANEYYAWAYALKLRLNGCLENADENPSKYRRDAIQLKKEIAKY